MTRKKKTHRRAGARWRLLVHEWLGKQPGSGIRYGKAHHVMSHGREGGKPIPDSDTSQTHILDGCDFDELVVGQFIHIEQQDTGTWWMDIAGLVIWVRVDRDGHPYGCDIYGPGDYTFERDGVHYRLTWSKPDDYVGKKDPEDTAP